MSRFKPRDTVARWIALTILIAMLTALAFNALFVQLAGVWARPPLSETGLLEKVAVIVRMIEAAEPSQRPQLTQAVGDDSFNVSWSATRAGIDVPILEDPVFHSDQLFKQLLKGPERRMEVYEPSDWPGPGGHYVLMVQLVDQSWLVFSAPSRSWGLAEGPRSLVVLMLVLDFSLGTSYLHVSVGRKLSWKASANFTHSTTARCATPPGNNHWIRVRVTAVI